jgi:tetratricopeptide (TPR) repeat protein
MRLKSILSRYGDSISKSSRVYKNIRNEIAELDVRASFVKTLLGDLSGAIEGFESINRRDLTNDDTHWIYLDDLENALAFGGFFDKALDINKQATSYKDNNIYEGFEVEKGSRFLLMFVPDKATLEVATPIISEKCLYDAGGIHDKKLPKLREIFYLFKLDKISGSEATTTTLDIVGDISEIFVPPIIRLILWNLYRFGSNEKKLKEIIATLEVMNFENNAEAEDLYDDLTILKRLLR